MANEIQLTSKFNNKKKNNDSVFKSSSKSSVFGKKRFKKCK